MRLALVHYTLPPVIGGVERVIAGQAEALRALGHEVELWDRASWPRLAARLQTGEPPPDGVLVHNVFTMPFDLAWTRELTHLTHARPDIVWVNWVHDVAAVNPAYAHLGWSEPPPAALPFAVSTVRAREWASVASLAQDRITVIPNGIDSAATLGLTHAIAQLARTRDLWNSQLLLLQPARLVRRKNIELGIRVVSELAARHFDARLIITGAPDPHQDEGKRYFDELTELASDCGVSGQIIFAGSDAPVTDADLPGLYALADALFFPSFSEGFGLPLLEALQHRLPLWCADLPVHREVLGAAQAHWFTPDTDPAALAERLLSWARQEPALNDRRRVWHRHDWRVLCKDHLEPRLLAGIKKR